MKEFTKLVLALAYFTLYLVPFRRSQRRVVIYYHGVTETEKKPFERQMRYLAKAAITIRPSEIKSTKLEDSLIVAVTFDDAFLNLSKNAMPILKACGIESAICVPTAYIGSTPGWDMEEGCKDRGEAIMSVADLKEVQSSGAELFSHTKTHPRLTDLDDHSLIDELSQSKSALEAEFNTPILAISYPHGACNNRVLEFAKNAGYLLGFGINPDFVEKTTPDLMVGRTLVLPTDGILTFALKIHGAYGILTHLKQWFGKRSIYPVGASEANS